MCNKQTKQNWVAIKIKIFFTNNIIIILYYNKKLLYFCNKYLIKYLRFKHNSKKQFEFLS